MDTVKPAVPTPPARSPAPSYQDLLKREKVAVPLYLKVERSPDMGTADLGIDRYVSKDFQQREKTHLWSRVWQLAGREADVLETGDHIVYDNADASVIVVRAADGGLNGFVNSCLHRARPLRTEDGRVSELRCPYHGFTWSLGGDFLGMPSEWDFPHLCPKQLQLPQVKVGTWGGFVFINLDPDCIPLLDYLGVLPQHFERFPLHDYYKGIHVRKTISCNWKVGHEAFLEAFHVIETHPQIMSYTGDDSTQYDVLDQNITRMMTARGVTSSHISALSEQEIAEEIMIAGRFVKVDGAARATVLADDVTAREFIGELNRDNWQKGFGLDLADATWAELEDAILYDVFPNIQVWAGYNRNIVYQFRPDGDNPDSCLFDMMILYRYPAGTPRPPSVPVIEVGRDQPLAEIETLGALGPILDQDVGNLMHMTRGLKASRKGAVSLGQYQEARIRHLHLVLDQYLARD